MAMYHGIPTIRTMKTKEGFTQIWKDDKIIRIEVTSEKEKLEERESTLWVPENRGIEKF